jgi:uncharacterized membrane protein HdeD (DUF308 family)
MPQSHPLPHEQQVEDLMSNQPTVSSSHPVLSEVARLWWLPLLRGIMMVILGVYALLSPGVTVAIFVQVFGFFLAFDGVLAIIAGVTGEVPSRGWTIARGVLAVIVGILVVGNPVFVAGIAAVWFVYLLGFAAIVSGAIEVFAAIRDRNQIEGEGWLILGGVIAVIFGILLLSAPLLFANTIVRIMGAVAIVGGIASIIFSLRLRGLNKKLQTHETREVRTP